VMPPERSVDIDTPWDLQLVEFLYSRQAGETDG
jgi:CMP-N-acetylneuraminic acid synthetase